MTTAGRGACEHCGESFDFRLIHCGFNESAYAYCADCGATNLLDTRFEERAGIPRHGRIDPEGERHLGACDCGGPFRADAGPRCPWCRGELNAERAAKWIEASAPGTTDDWRWQGNWSETYAVVIDGGLQGEEKTR